MEKLTKNKGITLIALIITIIVLLILVGIATVTLTGEKGLLGKASNAEEETKQNMAREKMNLKITTAQMKSYAETQEMPTLQYLADELCEDNEMEYVHLKGQEQASLEKITVGSTDSILTKLKEYPYEFEINSLLQLASINGVKLANNDTPSTEYVKKSDYDALLARVVALENISSSQSGATSTSNNYSATEQIVGKWIDGKNLWRKVMTISNAGRTGEYKANLDNPEMVSLRGRVIDSNKNWYDIPYADYDYTVRVYYNMNTDKILFGASSSNTFSKIYVIIEYTKTTETVSN